MGAPARAPGGPARRPAPCSSSIRASGRATGSRARPTGRARRRGRRSRTSTRATRSCSSPSAVGPRRRPRATCPWRRRRAATCRCAVSLACIAPRGGRGGAARGGARAAACEWAVRVDVGARIRGARRPCRGPRVAVPGGRGCWVAAAAESRRRAVEILRDSRGVHDLGVPWGQDRRRSRSAVAVRYTFEWNVR